MLRLPVQMYALRRVSKVAKAIQRRPALAQFTPFGCHLATKLHETQAVAFGCAEKSRPVGSERNGHGPAKPTHESVP
jgi:hypothetical protein